MRSRHIYPYKSFQPPSIMTANLTTAADSTPSRGFGMARFVLRAVTGAVAATRKAVRVVGGALAKRSSAGPKPRRRAPVRRAILWAAPQPPRHLPAWLRHLIDASNYE